MSIWYNPNLSPEEREEFERIHKGEFETLDVKAEVEKRIAETLVEHSFELAHQVARAYAQKIGCAFIPLDVYNDLVKRGILKKVYLR